MALFDAFRNKTAGKTVAIIDVCPDSVAGAYVRYGAHAPVLIYTRRLPVEHHRGEEVEAAMFRALDVLAEALVREGAPAALRATGSGSAHEVLVSIGAPWQEVTIRSEHIEKPGTFVFDERLVRLVLDRTRREIAGRTLADESVIGTHLNGYQTRSPYGKKVHRASILVLTSYIDQRIVSAITEKMRKLFHTRHVRPVAASSLRYEAVRAAFPHERNALMIDISRSAISLQLIRDGLLAATTVVERDAHHAQWVPEVLAQFAEFAKQFPLPRTIFLLAVEEEVGALRSALDSAHLETLWLSDNPPTIVSVLPSHLVGLIEVGGGAVADLPLLLAALFGAHRMN